MPELEQSLEEIEGDFWGDPPARATALVARVHALRRQPIRQFGVEDLRVLIAQRVGLETVVPLALDRLERNPLAEGDFYPGDLLVAVLRLPADHWRGYPAERARLRGVLDDVDLAAVDDDTRGDIAAFRGSDA